jgi:hypothetical protein
LFNLGHILERDKQAGDTELKIKELQNQIDQRAPRDEVFIVDDDGVTWEPLLDAFGHEL